MSEKNKYLTRRKFLSQAGIVTTGLSLGTAQIVSAIQNSVKTDIGNTGNDSPRIMIGPLWTIGDIGGAAITIGLLNLLYKHFPNYKMTQFGANEEFRAYSKEKFPDSDILNDEIRSGPAYKEALSKAEQDFGGIFPELSHEVADYVLNTFSQNYIEALKKHNPGFLKALSESKLYIFPSGMMLNYGQSTLSGMDFTDTLNWSLPLLAARKLGVPYSLYAQSFTAFEGSAAVYYFKNLLEDASFVTCRDSDTVNYVKSLGINPHGLMFIPDSTVSFNLRDDKWGMEFMKKKQLKPKEFLIVNPRTWPRESKITHLIGEERSNRHVHRLLTIIKDWVRKTGMKVLIASEVEPQVPYLKPLIYDPLPEDIKEYCEVLDEFWLPEQATSIYHNARILVHMDFHSFYMAIPEGTPCIGLMTRESGRKIWSFRDFKLGEYMFDVDTTPTEEIEKSIFYINEHYEQESKRIQKKVIPYLKGLEEKQMKIIGKVLNI